MSRMVRLGKTRHGQEGRRLSERRVSESNPVGLRFGGAADLSTPLRFTGDDSFRLLLERAESSVQKDNVPKRN